MKRFSQAAENNRQPVLEQLKRFLTAPATVLEIGSGTGQHATYFSEQLPHLTWQTTDLAINHESISAYVTDCAHENVLPPLVLDVCQRPWPVETIDVLYSANTLHIMPWQAVVAMFEALGNYLTKDAMVIFYGPFKYGGSFTTASNQIFDASLRSQDPHMGVRDIENIMALCEEIKLVLVEDIAMPANNQLLVFKRVA